MRMKVRIHESADAKPFAIIDEASGLVENVISATEEFAELWRGQNPGKLLIASAEAGPGWHYENGAFRP